MSAFAHTFSNFQCRSFSNPLVVSRKSAIRDDESAALRYPLSQSSQLGCILCTTLSFSEIYVDFKSK